MKSCSFFGHRDTPQTEELKQKVKKAVERLIAEEEVDTFLFGSRSKFDELCHIVVTEQKEKYPHIQRIAYLCKHETACLVGEAMNMKQQIKQLTRREVYVPEYEEIKKSDRVNSAGRASYIERNQWMVNESDFAIIYANKLCNESKSGTWIICKYAKERKKMILFLQ